MGKTILETKIPRKKDFLYYCGTSKDGNIVVCEAKMSHGGKKKKVVKKSKK